MKEDMNHIGANHARTDVTAHLAPTPVLSAQLDGSPLMQPSVSPAQLEGTIRQSVAPLANGVHLALTIRCPEAPLQPPA
jgi:hypothetical protein